MTFADCGSLTRKEIRLLQLAMICDAASAEPARRARSATHWVAKVIENLEARALFKSCTKLS